MPSLKRHLNWKPNSNQKSTAKLAIVDRVKGIEKNNIAINPKNVGEEITRLLHLNAEQFKKIILLPQNDFSRFLKSSTPDKEAILKRIFGTYIFTSFSNEIKAKNSEMNAVYLEHDRKQQNLYESSIWNPFELKELEYYSALCVVGFRNGAVALSKMPCI